MVLSLCGADGCYNECGDHELGGAANLPRQLCLPGLLQLRLLTLIHGFYLAN